MHIFDDVIEREPSPWMTIQEAAAYLRVTEHTVHSYCRGDNPKLQKYRVGGFNTIRLKREDVEALVQPMAVVKRTAPAPAPTEGPHGPYPSNRPPAKGRAPAGAPAQARRVSDPEPRWPEDEENSPA